MSKEAPINPLSKASSERIARLVHQNDLPQPTPANVLADDLQAWFDPQTRYVVALSGGVDSAVVAKAAAVSQSQALAVTAVGPSVAGVEQSDAKRVAEDAGLTHQLVTTNEIELVDYRRNDERRCYFCKSTLFRTLQAAFPGYQIVTGTTLDDLGDYRPGLQAAKEAAVRSPLAELKYGKAQVRVLATYWGLHVAEKPASPCLASRVAHGVEVTPELLSKIEASEEFLRSLGFRELRVRVHADGLARIEVPRSRIQELTESKTLQLVSDKLQSIGFRFVTLDLQGFRSGSLHPLSAIKLPNRGASLD